MKSRLLPRVNVSSVVVNRSPPGKLASIVSSPAHSSMTSLLPFATRNDPLVRAVALDADLEILVLGLDDQNTGVGRDTDDRLGDVPNRRDKETAEDTEDDGDGASQRKARRGGAAHCPWSVGGCH